MPENKIHVFETDRQIMRCTNLSGLIQCDHIQMHSICCGITVATVRSSSWLLESTIGAAKETPVIGYLEELQSRKNFDPCKWPNWLMKISQDSQGYIQAYLKHCHVIHTMVFNRSQQTGEVHTISAEVSTCSLLLLISTTFHEVHHPFAGYTNNYINIHVKIVAAFPCIMLHQ